MIPGKSLLTLIYMFMSREFHVICFMLIYVGDFGQTLPNIFCCTINHPPARRLLTSASKSNGLDLNRHALGKLLNRNARASGLVGEVLLVDGVHLGEVVHGGDEDVDLTKESRTRQQSKI